MRIVSLLPSATEILFGIGAGSEVVGVTHECDYPIEALALPKLTSASAPELPTPAAIDRHVRSAVHAGSSLYHLDAELLERLQPDLIVTQELCAVCAVSYDIVATATKRLRSDPRIVSLEPASLREVFATIGFLGEITGHGGEATALVTELEGRLRGVALRQAQGDTAQAQGDTAQAQGDTAQAQGDTARFTTLVLEWTDPPMSAGHWIPELIEVAGGAPILANPGANSQRLEWKAIAAADPDAVIVAPCGFDIGKTERAIEELGSNRTWRSLRAVRTGRVLAMDGNAYMSRPGPRLVDSAEIVAQWYTSSAEYAG